MSAARDSQLGHANSLYVTSVTYEAARLYDKEALRVLVSVMMDAKQPASLRLTAANDLLDRAYGRPPIAIDATTREASLKKIIHEVRWLPPDPNDRSTVTDYRVTRPQPLPA
jgi:hypothetical protein